jgi:predicted GNAT family N-acyltransferase
MTTLKIENIKWHLSAFNALSAYQIYNITQAREQVFMKDQQCVYVDADGIEHVHMILEAL